MAELGTAVAGDEAPALEVNDEGAAPESLSDAELEQALHPETTEEQAEEVAPKKEEPAKDEKKPAVSQEEYDKLKKKVENQELFIQRQANEVGELRKLKENLQRIAKEKRALAAEQLTMDPAAALDTHAEAREAEHQATAAGEQEAILANKAVIHEALPDYENRIESIAAAAIEMGVPAEFIENYKKNPYSTPLGVLLPYARAAALRDQYLRQSELVAKLKEQLAAIPKTQGDLAAKIKATAKQVPVVTGKVGSQTRSGVTGFESLDETQIPELSAEDLDRLLKESKL